MTPHSGPGDAELACSSLDAPARRDRHKGRQKLQVHGATVPESSPNDHALVQWPMVQLRLTFGETPIRL